MSYFLFGALMKFYFLTLVDFLGIFYYMIVNTWGETCHEGHLARAPTRPRNGRYHSAVGFN